MSQFTKEMWTVSNGGVKIDIIDDEIQTFDGLYRKYKEGLRKEVKMQGKKNHKKK